MSLGILCVFVRYRKIHDPSGMNFENVLSTSQVAIVVTFAIIDFVLLRSYMKFRPAAIQLYGRIAYLSHMCGMPAFLALNLSTLIVSHLSLEAHPLLTLAAKLIGFSGILLAAGVFRLAEKSYAHTRAWTRPGYRLYSVVFVLASLQCLFDTVARTQNLLTMWVLVHAYATCRLSVFLLRKVNLCEHKPAYDVGLAIGVMICTGITAGLLSTVAFSALNVTALLWNLRWEARAQTSRAVSSKSEGLHVYDREMNL